MLPANNIPTEALTNPGQLQKLEIKDLAFNYNGNDIFSGLNFSIHRGELVGLSGISGKGKTTLINILLGFIDPASGSVFLMMN
jgi:ABC-type multidrug transport system fused ATPase/permease subunit